VVGFEQLQGLFGLDKFVVEGVGARQWGFQARTVFVAVAGTALLGLLGDEFAAEFERAGLGVLVGGGVHSKLYTVF
jgi:hypothetical protein